MLNYYLRVTTMIKLLLLPTLVISLTGCVAYMPVKYATDKVCAATDAQQDVLAEQFDAATFPHKIRVECHLPQNKPKVTYSE